MNTTNFKRVSEMNQAFGNPKGHPADIDKQRVLRQVMNIPDETGEVVIALGADKERVKALVQKFKQDLMAAVASGTGELDLHGVRDGLCDIHVFAYGGHHLMGIDADRDMNSVVDGVMTRFIKDEADKQATIALHAAKGVTNVYFEGKFLKSASYREPVFYQPA